MQATLNKVKYEIHLEEKIHGLCSSGKKSSPQIYLNDGFKNTRICMETLVHELLHACNWDASEVKVDAAARDITKVLWRLYQPRPEKLCQ